MKGKKKLQVAASFLILNKRGIDKIYALKNRVMR